MRRLKKTCLQMMLISRKLFEETEEDMFTDDADLEETVDFSTGEVVEDKT